MSSKTLSDETVKGVTVTNELQDQLNKLIAEADRLDTDNSDPREYFKRVNDVGLFILYHRTEIKIEAAKDEGWDVMSMVLRRGTYYAMLHHGWKSPTEDFWIWTGGQHVREIATGSKDTFDEARKAAEMWLYAQVMAI